MDKCVLFENKLTGRKGVLDVAMVSKFGRSILLLIAFSLFSRLQAPGQGTWVPLTNTAPDYNEGVMLLLTDGTVLCKTSSGAPSVLYL